MTPPYVIETNNGTPLAVVATDVKAAHYILKFRGDKYRKVGKNEAARIRRELSRRNEQVRSISDEESPLERIAW